jgi:hypothetical protein
MHTHHSIWLHSLVKPSVCPEGCLILIDANTCKYLERWCHSSETENAKNLSRIQKKVEKPLRFCFTPSDFCFLQGLLKLYVL